MGQVMRAVYAGWPWAALAVAAAGATLAGVLRLEASAIRSEPEPSLAVSTPSTAPAASGSPPTAGPPVSRLITVAQAAAGRAGLHLGAITVSSPTELAIEVRGSYPAIKQWLAELIDRFDALVVTRLDLRAADAPSEATASNEVRGDVRVLWMMPSTPVRGLTGGAGPK